MRGVWEPVKQDCPFNESPLVKSNTTNKSSTGFSWCYGLRDLTNWDSNILEMDACQEASGRTLKRTLTPLKAGGQVREKREQALCGASWGWGVTVKMGLPVRRSGLEVPGGES